MKKILLLTSLMTVLAFASAQIIHVPGDYPTIQEGIDAAQFFGDTVLVDDGTYWENISFIGKRITVASYFIIDGDESHIENTIINGSQASNPDRGSVVFFEMGEDSTAILCGFTITGGTGTIVLVDEIRAGGGISIENSGAKIIHNKIIENWVETNLKGSGGGIAVGDATNNSNYVVIRHNQITNNVVESHDFAEGGGITMYANSIIEDNVIMDNEISSEIENAVGGGIRAFGVLESRYISCFNNVISRNIVHSGSLSIRGGAGGMQAYNCFGIISNNTIQENEIISDMDGGLGGGLHFGYCGTSMILKNNFILNNSAGESGKGGGIGYHFSNIQIINNIIEFNVAQFGSGIYGYSNLDGITQIVNNTIAFNEWEGIYLDEADAVILNSILWNDGNEITLSNANVEVAYSDVFGGWDGEGNINEDPEFMDDLYHISEESPCKDAGIEELTMMGILVVAPDYDYEGTPRPMYAGIDMGADEYPPTVGIDEYEANIFNMRVYPNPTSGKMHLSYNLPYSGDLILNILNIHGKLLQPIQPTQQSVGENTVDLDLTGFPSGLYFVRIIVGQRVETTKIIIQK